MLRLEDLRLFDADYTLDPVADEFDVPKGTMRMLLLSIYEQLGALNLDEQEKDFEKQEFPKVLLNTIFLSRCLKKCLDSKLLEKTEEGYSLTKTCWEIFIQASIKQKDLDF